MRVYHDWEFLETNNSVYPISVGMVAENGQTLYRVFTDAPWELIAEHDWLSANVVPNLDAVRINVGDTKHVRYDVQEFLKRASEVDGALELWGWYSSYDHVCLGQLFGAMVNLPEYVPMWTNDIKQEVVRLGNVRIPDLREPAEKPHNALDDARAELRMHQWLMRYEKGGKLRERPSFDKPFDNGTGWKNPGTPWYRDPMSMEH
jgi:3'-5' exoribonuclease-like protein